MRPFDFDLIDGFAELVEQSQGDARVTIAVLDGDVDRAHPSLSGADLEVLPIFEASPDDASRQHGTHVASILFGQDNGGYAGLAPKCRGIVIPIFQQKAGGGVYCSQIDLAHGVALALDHGADIINVSGGELSPAGAAHPLLENTLRRAAEQGALVVAAAGNDGCACLHIPAATPGVLAVGALDATGRPLEISNWGDRYQTQGVLAPGEEILGASLSGGSEARSGTSFAAPIVSGVAALLLSQARQTDDSVRATQIRQLLLDTADGCTQDTDECRKLLVGKINVKRATELLDSGRLQMSDDAGRSQETEPSTSLGPTPDAELAPTAAAETAARAEAVIASAADVEATAPTCRAPVAESAVAPSAGCGCDAAGPWQLVFALGQLGFDYGSVARRDSIEGHMDKDANPDNAEDLIKFLKENPEESGSVIWTLKSDETPIYAIEPDGPFASNTFDKLRKFLDKQQSGKSSLNSIPGYIKGTATLLNGQVVRKIVPTSRGMQSWKIADLAKNVGGGDPDVAEAIAQFLERVYHELRNLGVAASDRAINYAATNAFHVADVFADAYKDDMELDSIEVERSPICRPESECWDVKILFFFPERQVQTVRRVYRFTVDVSDVVPVLIGDVRHWHVR